MHCVGYHRLVSVLFVAVLITLFLYKNFFHYLYHLISIQFIEHIAPTEPPQMVTIIILSSTSLMASWQAPTLSQQNGIIRQYALVILDVASGEETNLISFGTSTNATGLKPFTSYSCKVAAFTVSYGPYSASVNVTTQQDGK